MVEVKKPREGKPAREFEGPSITQSTITESTQNGCCSRLLKHKIKKPLNFSFFLLHIYNVQTQIFEPFRLLRSYGIFANPPSLLKKIN